MAVVATGGSVISPCCRLVLVAAPCYRKTRVFLRRDSQRRGSSWRYTLHSQSAGYGRRSGWLIGDRSKSRSGASQAWIVGPLRRLMHWKLTAGQRGPVLACVSRYRVQSRAIRGSLVGWFRSRGDKDSNKRRVLTGEARLLSLLAGRKQSGRRIRDAQQWPRHAISMASGARWEIYQMEIGVAANGAGSPARLVARKAEASVVL